MPEPPGNSSALDDLDRPTPLPQRVRGATLTPEYLAELDEPVPYVPVDLAPVSSSQAGVAAHQYSPTRYGATPVRVFGFNVVTIDPQGNHGGPRLDGVVSRQRAEDELDELEPFMTGGYKSVLVELREVTR
jgi:hypothetical protein